VAADPSDTLAVSAPACERRQLGDGSAQSAATDGGRKVYGSFRVVNTSEDACTVEGEGAVDASGSGATGGSHIQIVDHTSGDPATQLPEPAAASDELVLKPGQAYQVGFAWIPKDCPASSSPSPEAGAAEKNVAESPRGEAGDPDGTATGGESAGTTGGPPSSGPPDSGPPSSGPRDSGPPSSGDPDSGGPDTGGGGSEGGDGEGAGESGGAGAGAGDGGGKGGAQRSLRLSHTPEAGDPAAAETTLNGGCAGTVYRTGVLPAE
jgi:hypothetical protein